MENFEVFHRTRTIVSKKIAKKAVTRNSVRRQIHGAILQQTEATSQGYDIIIIPKKKILDADFSTIKSDLSTIWIN
jgi:ribonuclease P protein component